MRPAHTVATWKGDIVNPSSSAILEQWQFSLRGPANNIESEAGLDALATALRLCWDQNLKDRFSPKVILRETSVARVGADGNWLKRSDGSYYKGVTETDLVGTGESVTNYPAQLALCVGLVTARSGPTGKGRFYLPFPDVYFLNGDRVLSTADQASMSVAAEEFVTDVAAALGSVQVVSGGTIANGHVGYMSTVTAIRLGVRPDVVRSRARSMPENYVINALD